jgi:hypothetical protein
MNKNDIHERQERTEAQRIIDELEARPYFTDNESVRRVITELLRLDAENKLLHERHSNSNNILIELTEQRDALLAEVKQAKTFKGGKTQWID